MEFPASSNPPVDSISPPGILVWFMSVSIYINLSMIYNIKAAAIVL